MNNAQYGEGVFVDISLDSVNTVNGAWCLSLSLICDHRSKISHVVDILLFIVVQAIMGSVFNFAVILGRLV